MGTTSSEQPEGLEKLSTEELLPIVYDELRRLAAARILRGNAGMTLQPTALVHEAWIRLSSRFDRNWDSREHFFNAAAITMRRILINRAKQKATVKHGGAQENTFFLPPNLDEATGDERLLLIDESLQVLEKENPEDARIVMLKFFAGLTNQEIAETLGVNVRTIERRWAGAKIRLFQIVREIERLEK